MSDDDDDYQVLNQGNVFFFKMLKFFEILQTFITSKSLSS